MLARALSELTFADIEQLATDHVAESRTLDFKQGPVGGSHEDKREFLADVSSFANAGGGDIVLGVVEAGGFAEEAPGIELTNPDAEKRRLGDLIRSGLEPKLVNFEIEWVVREASRGALIVRIPRSWSMPHRVTLQGSNKFYVRNGTGKHQMNVQELRDAFNLSQTVFDRIERFRHERIEKISSNRGSLAVPDGAKVVFHVLPLVSFAERLDIRVGPYTTLVLPLGAGGANHRYTSEGFALCSGPVDGETASRAYSLLFRSGVIECVASVGHERDGDSLVPLREIETNLDRAFYSIRHFLRREELPPPIVLGLTFVGVAGHRVAIRPELNQFSYHCREEIVTFAEQITTEKELDAPATTTLKPLFDTMWNAFGAEGSPNYNSRGEWHPALS